MVTNLRPLLFSIAASGFANAALQVVFGWVVLQATRDAFLVALVFAVQWLPRLLIGLPAGAVASHPSRRVWMVVTAVMSGGAVASLVIAGAVPTVLGVIAVSFIVGSLDALRMTLTQTAVYDAADAHGAMAALSASNLSITLSRGAGGLIGGIAFDLLGAPLTLAGCAVAYVASGVVLIAYVDAGAATRVRLSTARQVVTHSIATARGAVAGPRVRVLTFAAIAAEIFAFSSVAVLPVLAEDVLNVGASGLGLLVAGKAVGSALGLLGLAQFGRRQEFPRGAVLALMLMAFGVLVAALGISTALLVAVGLSVGIGVASGVADTLIQSLLQSTSIEAGHAGGLGIWVWAVGFGPVGQLEVGAMAVVFGVQAALIVNGLALLLVSGLLARRIRALT